MIQNLFQRLSSYHGCAIVITLLLAGGLSEACSDDRTELLSEGRYPVIPTVRVQAIGGEGSDGTWIGGEQIAVQAVSSEYGWDKAEVKIYEKQTDSVLNSSKPIWWKSSSEKKKVRAWYCGDGSTAEEGVNASAVPSVWYVQADQSAEGYNASAFLFAPAREATFAVSSIVPMKFYHQTAKVVMSVSKEGDVGSKNEIGSVTINGMALSGKYSAPETDGETIGKWTLDEIAAEDGVILHELASAEDGAIVSYGGFVIPQETANLELAVKTTVGDVKCTLPSDAEALEAGDVRKYKLTVKKQPLKLIADVIKVKIAYEPDDVKFGDYFYVDGTTSDGGLRTIYTDGSFKMEKSKPAPVPGKEVVGIVFQTDPERIGQAEKDALAAKGVDNPHGLVMAVKNAAADVNWGPNNVDESDVFSTQVLKELYNDISGYANYTAVCTAHSSNLDSYPAFKAVSDYNETCVVTGNTTGWFLPSAGQLWDILQVLGDCPALSDLENQTSAASAWQHKFEQQNSCLVNLNGWMEKIGAGYKNAFLTSADSKYWTSTERSKTNSWYWRLNKNGIVYIQGEKKTEKGNVRPVLAF